MHDCNVAAAPALARLPDCPMVVEHVQLTVHEHGVVGDAKVASCDPEFDENDEGRCRSLCRHDCAGRAWSTTPVP